jgi:hypothetical protein
MRKMNLGYNHWLFKLHRDSQRSKEIHREIEINELNSM